MLRAESHTKRYLKSEAKQDITMNNTKIHSSGNDGKSTTQFVTQKQTTKTVNI